MRGYRKNWLVGYVEVKVKGEYPERFFELCARNGIQVWEIKKTDQKTCTGRIRITDISLLRELKRKTIYKIYFKKRYGFPFRLQAIWDQKPFNRSFVSDHMYFYIVKRDLANRYCWLR